MSTPSLTTVQAGYDYIDSISHDAYLDWILPLQKRFDSLSEVEQFFVVQYLWKERLFQPVELIQQLFQNHVLALILNEEDLVGQYLEYLYAVGSQNTKAQEDELVVRSVHATVRNMFLTSSARYYEDKGTLITQQQVIDVYIRSVQKTADTIMLATWMTSLRTTVSAYAIRVEYRELSEEELYEKTEELRQVIDFFVGVVDTTIFPLVLQTRFPELFETVSDVQPVAEVEKASAIETAGDTSRYADIQAGVIETYGDITTMSPDQVAPILTYLSQEAERQQDPTIATLIYFDTTTQVFEWNTDVISTP